MVDTMCVSYLPAMVKSFGTSEVQTGRYVGLIASSVYLGMLTCSFLWGHFADTKGHKLVLLITMVGMTLTTLLFGFSTTITWALVARIAAGVFTGLYTVSKSVLSHALDETNTALGFSLFFTSWTLAFIVGPTLGGFLVFPAKQYPEFFSADSFFARFGIMLPNLLLIVCNAVLIVLVVIFIRKDRRIEEEERAEERAEETASLLQQDEQHYGTINNHDVSYKQYAQKHNLTKGSNPRKSKIFKRILGLLRSKDFAICLLMNAIHGFSVVGLEDMCPVFLATSMEYSGLGLNTSQIGMLFFGSALILLL